MRRKALRLASEYRDECLATFGRAHFRYASALNTLGFVHKNRGEVALAVGAYAGALALLGQTAEGRATPSWAAVAANVGACYRAMADGARSGWERMQLLETSLAYLSEALAVREAALAADDPAIGDTLSLIGGAMRAASDPDIAPGGGGAVLAGAERAARRAVAHLSSAAGAAPATVATASANLAVLLLQELPSPHGGEPSAAEADALAAAERSRACEAEALLRDALATRRAKLGEIHPTTIETLLLLAQAVEAAGAPGASTEAEVATLRATADELYAELQDLQAEDEAADSRA